MTPSCVSVSFGGWNSAKCAFCPLRIFLALIVPSKYKPASKKCHRSLCYLSVNETIICLLGKGEIRAGWGRQVSEYGARQKGIASRMINGKDSPRTFVDFTILPVHGSTRIRRTVQCLFTEWDIYSFSGRHGENGFWKRPSVVCTSFNQEQWGAGLIWESDPRSMSKGNLVDRMLDELESG